MSKNELREIRNECDNGILPSYPSLNLFKVIDNLEHKNDKLIKLLNIIISACKLHNIEQYIKNEIEEFNKIKED